MVYCLSLNIRWHVILQIQASISEQYSSKGWWLCFMLRLFRKSVGNIQFPLIYPSKAMYLLKVSIKTSHTLSPSPFLFSLSLFFPFLSFISTSLIHSVCWLRKRTRVKLELPVETKTSQVFAVLYNSAPKKIWNVISGVTLIWFHTLILFSFDKELIKR